MEIRIYAGSTESLREKTGFPYEESGDILVTAPVPIVEGSAALEERTKQTLAAKGLAGITNAHICYAISVDGTPHLFFTGTPIRYQKQST